MVTLEQRISEIKSEQAKLENLHAYECNRMFISGALIIPFAMGAVFFHPLWGGAAVGALEFFKRSNKAINIKESLQALHKKTELFRRRGTPFSKHNLHR